MITATQRIVHFTGVVPALPIPANTTNNELGHLIAAHIRPYLLERHITVLINPDGNGGIVNAHNEGEQPRKAAEFRIDHHQPARHHRRPFWMNRLGHHPKTTTKLAGA